MIGLIEKEPGSSLKKITEARKRIKSHSDKWSLYGEPVAYYDLSFQPVLDFEDTAQYLKSRKNPIVIDLMGPSDTIADLFSQLPYEHKQGIAVTLTDQRNEFKRERDVDLGITQINGDITRKSTWTAIENKLSGEKADLIMERAAGGLELIPMDEIFFYITINRAWNLLSQNQGVMLLNTPWELDLVANGVRTHDWVRCLNENGITAQYEPYLNGALKLIKTPDSPTKLPRLQK